MKRQKTENNKKNQKIFFDRINFIINSIEEMLKKCDFLFIFLVICIKVLYMYMAKSTVAGDEDCTKCIEPRRMEEREYDIKSDTAEYD